MHTDRGDLTAPLIVDALGWRRVLSNAKTIQPPKARLSRGLEVHPKGTAADRMDRSRGQVQKVSGVGAKA